MDGSRIFPRKRPVFPSKTARFPLENRLKPLSGLHLPPIFVGNLPSMLATRFLPFIGALLLCTVCFANEYTLTSPDGRIQLTLSPTDSFPDYSVRYSGITLIEASPLDLQFKEPGRMQPVSFFGHRLLTHC